jgi:hypothetical protein
LLSENAGFSTVPSLEVTESDKREDSAVYTVAFVAADETRRAEGRMRWRFYKQGGRFETRDAAPSLEYTDIIPLKFDIEDVAGGIPDAIDCDYPASDLLDAARYSVVEENLDDKSVKISVAGVYRYLNSSAEYDFTIDYLYDLDGWRHTRRIHVPLVFSQVSGTELSGETALQLASGKLFSFEGHELNVSSLNVGGIVVEYSEFFDAAIARAFFNEDSAYYTISGTLVMEFLSDGDRWAFNSVYAESEDGYVPKIQLTEDQIEAAFIGAEYVANDIRLTATGENTVLSGHSTPIKDGDAYKVTAAAVLVSGIMRYTFDVEAAFGFDPAAGYVVRSSVATLRNITFAEENFERVFSGGYSIPNNPSDISSSGTATITVAAAGESKVSVSVNLGGRKFTFYGSLDARTGEIGALSNTSASLYVTYKMLFTVSASISYSVSFRINDIDWEKSHLSGTLSFDTSAIGVPDFYASVSSA